MRLGVHGNGRKLLGPPNRYSEHAPPLLGVDEGSKSEGSDGDGKRAVIADAPAQARSPTFARVKVALLSAAVVN